MKPGFTIFALLSSIGLLVVGNGLQGTLIGVRAGIEGMSDRAIGVMMSAFFAGYIGGSIVTPKLVALAGHARTFAALASLASAVALCHAIVITPLSWTVLRALYGCCYAGLILVAESWLNGASDRSVRGRVLAIYGAVTLTAWAGGQALLEVAPATGFVLFCVVSIFMSVALVPITLTQATVPGALEARRASLSRLFAISPFAVAGIFTIGLAMGSFWGMGPTYAQRIGLDTRGIAAFMGLTSVGALAFQWPIGWLSDVIDRRKVLLGASIGCTIVAAFLAMEEVSTSRLLVLAFLFGGLGTPIYSVVVAEANDHIGEHELVATASGMIMIYGVGAALGPLAGSWAMAESGPGGLFIYCAAVFCAFSVYGLYRLVRRKAVPQAEKEHYVALPLGMPAAVQLDPRAEPESVMGLPLEVPEEVIVCPWQVDTINDKCDDHDHTMHPVPDAEEVA